MIEELWRNSEALYTISSEHQKELNGNNRDFVPCCCYVMGRVGFNFPIFLTLIHYAVCWILPDG
ncbi:hypothetical protein Bca52824_026872 [Brassica carinata]|uniref:Uncharacterized protein n=1 Tax=Brassica carinata TaxID=52824 RepID=A0A8X7V975_BRACI|nr:hypothetical protein Bca52824_026872 [Brassica carinata]